MKINSLQIKFEDGLADALMDYFDGDELLYFFFQLIFNKYIEKLLWDGDNIRRYNGWFFCSINNLFEETRLGDEELSERLLQLEDLSLLHVRDSYYDGMIQMRIDTEMIRAIYKLHEAKKD